MRWSLLTLPLLVSLVACKGETPSDPSTGGLVRRIESADALLPGTEAAGRIGDYLLDNGTVRFVVQSPESSTGWSLFGGSLVDASAVGEDGPSPDLLEEIFVQCDLRSFAPRTAEIVSPGGPDTPGILRLVGPDGGIPYLDVIFGVEPLDVTITVDLIIPPSGRSLDIEIAAKDERKRGARELACGVMLLPGDEYRLFVPDGGFTEDLAGPHDFIAAEASGGAASYIFSRPDGAPVEVILDGLPFLPIGQEPQPFLANATLRDAYRITLSEPGQGVAGALAAAGIDVAEQTRQVELQFEGADLTVLSAPSVTFTPAGAAAPLNASRPDATGRVQVALPPGGYEVALFDREVQGVLVAASVEVPAGAGAFETTLQVGTLGVVALDAIEVGLDGVEKGPTPVRARAIAGTNANPAGAAVFEAYLPASSRFALPVGTYTLVVSRGPDHERVVTEVEVVAGETASVQARLERVVDHAGWIAADLHVHGTHSTDSEISKRARVLGAVAEGLDLLVSTDHDAVTDYQPTVEALGLEAMLRTAPGAEISPLYGHINGFPLRPSTPDDHWRPAWFLYKEDGQFDRVREPHEVVAALREEGAEVVQLNHPRSSTAIFDYLHLDSETGVSERQWPGADAMEILNGKRFDEYPGLLADHAGLLRSGKRLTVTGTSDVHVAFGVGYARTFVRVPSSAPGFDLDAVWANLRAGRAVAASGAFVELVARRGADSAEIGETLSGTGPVELEVRVQAPSWITPERVRVLSEGEVVFERDITADDADPSRPALRLAHTFTATVTGSSFYMVEVRGSGGAPNVQEVLTVTNPVFVTP